MIETKRYRELIELVPIRNRSLFDKIYFNKKINTDELRKEVINAIEAVTNVTFEQMLSRCREADLVTARHIFFLVMRSCTTATYQEIGKMIGRDHSTVLYGVNKAISDYHYSKQHKIVIDAVLERIDRDSYEITMDMINGRRETHI
jgi:chromosomal replication initiation ATPase DnaA